MSMQTGVATGIVDLATKFKDFAVGEGFTLNSFATLENGKVLHLELDDAFFHYRFYNNDVTGDIRYSHGLNQYGVFGNIGPAYDGGADWCRQPGTLIHGTVPFQVGFAPGIVNLNTSSIPYYFFAFDDPAPALYLIVEYPTGVYQWIIAGRLRKFGTYTGGLFCFAPAFPGNPTARNVAFLTGNGSLSGQGMLYVEDVDEFSGMATNLSFGSNYPNPRITGYDCFFRESAGDNPIGYSGLSPLQPYVLFMTRGGAVSVDYDEGRMPISEMGQVPNLHHLNMTGLVPGGEYPSSGSGDTYRVFPVTRLDPLNAVSDNANPPRSKFWGFGVKSN